MQSCNTTKMFMHCFYYLKMQHLLNTDKVQLLIFALRFYEVSTRDMQHFCDKEPSHSPYLVHELTSFIKCAIINNHSVMHIK